MSTSQRRKGHKGRGFWTLKERVKRLEMFDMFTYLSRFGGKICLLVWLLIHAHRRFKFGGGRHLRLTLTVQSLAVVGSNFATKLATLLTEGSCWLDESTLARFGRYDIVLSLLWRFGWYALRLLGKHACRFATFSSAAQHLCDLVFLFLLLCCVLVCVCLEWMGVQFCCALCCLFCIF